MGQVPITVLVPGVTSGGTPPEGGDPAALQVASVGGEGGNGGGGGGGVVVTTQIIYGKLSDDQTLSSFPVSSGPLFGHGRLSPP